MSPKSSEYKQRKAHILRQTKETRVEVDFNLDGNGRCDIQSGIGFLDHMLEQFIHHGLFDLRLEAQGDLHVDMHHTVEDMGLTIGEAFLNALGEHKGIVRCASSFVPMDESLALASVDFSGRPYAVIQTAWHNTNIGVLPTSLIDHFWESITTSARCNLHLIVLYGKDDHHQAEAMFKAAGRAIPEARVVYLQPRAS
jgi:imidazoleglycerol-phosphate dehydratase